MKNGNGPKMPSWQHCLHASLPVQEKCTHAGEFLDGRGVSYLRGHWERSQAQKLAALHVYKSVLDGQDIVIRYIYGISSIIDISSRYVLSRWTCAENPTAHKNIRNTSKRNHKVTQRESGLILVPMQKERHCL